MALPTLLNRAVAARRAGGAAGDARRRCRWRGVRGGGRRPTAPRRLRRRASTVLQVNVGKRCNQACHHCHVDAGPDRTRGDVRRGARRLPDACWRGSAIPTLDITGGAPELHPRFRDLVVRARALGRRVIDRCNLTITTLPNYARPARVPRRASGSRSWPRCRRTRRRRPIGSAATACSRRRSRRCASSTRVGYGVDGTGLELNARDQSGGRVPAGGAGGARARLEARAAAPLRHRVQPAVHDHQHADQPLPRVAGALGQPAGATSTGSCRRSTRPTVPGVMCRTTRQRRLGRPALRLRLQPDARSAGRWPASRRSILDLADDDAGAGAARSTVRS